MPKTQGGALFWVIRAAWCSVVNTLGENGGGCWWFMPIDHHQTQGSYGITNKNPQVGMVNGGTAPMSHPKL